MSTTVPFLTWTPYQGGAAGTLVAVVVLDASIDSEFIVPVVGQFKTPSSALVIADSVIIFNTKNNGDVDVTIGGLGLIDVPAFVRDSIQLSNSNPQEIKISLGFSTGILQLQFYKGTPPISPQLYNYAGAVLAASGSAYQAINQNVQLNDVLQYFNGPIVTLTQGTWAISAKALATDTTVTNSQVNIRIVDDAMVIYDSNAISVPVVNNPYPGSLNAIVTVASGTMDFTLQANAQGSTHGLLLWNASGNGKDTSIAASQIS